MNIKELEVLIDRFTRFKISRVKSRDLDYSLLYIKKNLAKQEICIQHYINFNFPEKQRGKINNSILFHFKKLYHKYLLGYDIIEIINSTEYYSKIYSTFNKEKIQPKNSQTKNGKSRIELENQLNLTSWTEQIIFPADFVIPSAPFQFNPLSDENSGTIKKIYLRAFVKYLAFMEVKRWININGLTPPIKVVEPEKTKSVILYNNLEKYGFFTLPKLEILTTEQQTKLIELISINKMPYIIAMFDYLNFIDWLYKKYCKTLKERNIKIASWFDTDKDGTAVRRSINSLNPTKKKPIQRNKAYTHNEHVTNKPKENERYAAYKHIENVEIDYEKIKKGV